MSPLRLPVAAARARPDREHADEVKLPGGSLLKWRLVTDEHGRRPGTLHLELSSDGPPPYVLRLEVTGEIAMIVEEKHLD